MEDFGCSSKRDRNSKVANGIETLAGFKDWGRLLLEQSQGHCRDSGLVVEVSRLLYWKRPNLWIFLRLVEIAWTLWFHPQASMAGW